MQSSTYPARQRRPCARLPARGEGSGWFRRRRGAHAPGTVLSRYAY